MARLEFMERHLMHNSNKFKLMNSNKIKQKSGAPSGAATPCCGGTPGAKFK
jgi:hypothetical protein